MGRRVKVRVRVRSVEEIRHDHMGSLREAQRMPAQPRSFWADTKRLALMLVSGGIFWS